jgi:hypothetical protein
MLGRLLILLILSAVVTGPEWRVRDAAAADPFTDLRTRIPDGVVYEELARRTITRPINVDDPHPWAGPRVIFERLRLQPGEVRPIQEGLVESNVYVDELRYLDRGALTLQTDRGSEIVTKGRTIQVPILGVAGEAVSAQLRNDDIVCASVLSITAVFSWQTGAGPSINPTPPPAPTSPCPPPVSHSLVGHSVPYDNGAWSAYFVLARATLEPGATWDLSGYLGDVSILVEAGTLTFVDSVGNEILRRTGEEVSLAVNAARQLRNDGDRRATLLMYGMVPTAQDPETMQTPGLQLAFSADDWIGGDHRGAEQHLERPSVAVFDEHSLFSSAVLSFTLTSQPAAGQLAILSLTVFDNGLADSGDGLDLTITVNNNDRAHHPFDAVTITNGDSTQRWLLYRYGIDTELRKGANEIVIKKPELTPPRESPPYILLGDAILEIERAVPPADVARPDATRPQSAADGFIAFDAVRVFHTVEGTIERRGPTRDAGIVRQHGSGDALSFDGYTRGQFVLGDDRWLRTTASPPTWVHISGVAEAV